MADELHASREHPREDQTPMPTTVIIDALPGPSSLASHRSKWSAASGAARVGALEIALAMLAAACTEAPGAPVAATVTTAPSKPGPYIALGDSYTSGPDTPTQVGAPAGCQPPTATTRPCLPSTSG